jgi:hypothetical protein
VRTFLGRGSDSPRHDEDTMAMAADGSRAYRTLGRGLRPISSLPMHMKGSSPPSWSGVTSIGGSYLDGREDGISNGVHRPGALSISEPCLRAGKKPHKGETGGTEWPPVTSPPHRRTQI